MKIQFIRLMTLFFMLAFLSCGRTPYIQDHVDDAFLHGTAEGLYRIQDLKMVLSEEAVKLQKDSNKQSLMDYKAILSTKENLYEKNTKANILNLKKLLRIHTTEEGEKVKISSGLNIFIDPEIPFLNEYQILDYTIPEIPEQQNKVTGNP